MFTSIRTTSRTCSDVAGKEIILRFIQHIVDYNFEKKNGITRKSTKEWLNHYKRKICLQSRSSTSFLRTFISCLISLICWRMQNNFPFSGNAHMVHVFFMVYGHSCIGLCVNYTFYFVRTFGTPQALICS